MPKRSDDHSPDDAARCERNRRGLANAADMTFGLLKSEVVAVDGGWRDARMLDGEFSGWLCSHVHATVQEAERCPEKESLILKGKDMRPDFYAELTSEGKEFWDSLEYDDTILKPGESL